MKKSPSASLRKGRAPETPLSISPKEPVLTALSKLGYKKLRRLKATLPSGHELDGLRAKEVSHTTPIRGAGPGTIEDRQCFGESQHVVWRSSLLR
jgi:hypothetical protein